MLRKTFIFIGMFLSLNIGWVYAEDLPSNDLIESVQRQAEAGDIQAQYKMGEIYEAIMNKKPPKERDISIPMRWYKMASEGDHPGAQERLANYYVYLRYNQEEALKLFTKAANNGNTSAQRRLAGYYRDGYGGVAKNKAEADKWYKILVDKYFKQAHQGDVNAYYELGRIYSTGNQGVAKNIDTAIEWYKKAADKGNMTASERLAEIYRQRGDVSESLAWYKKAADKGDSIALQNIAATYISYDSGFDEYADDAVKWLQLRADAGELAGLHDLGRLYARGRGVNKDYQKAVTYLEEAATKYNNVNSQAYTAILYDLGGNGLTKDKEKSLYWYTKAAENGHAASQYYLGLRYIDKEDSLYDFDKGLSWIKKSADHGYDPARKKYIEIKG